MKKRRILYSLFILCAVAVALSVGLTLAKYIATLNGTPFKVHIDAHKTYYTYAVLDADTGELSIRDRKAVVANGKALKKDENKTYLVDRDGTYEYGANGIVYTLPTSNGYGTTTPGQSIAAGLSLDDANDGWTMVHNGYGGDVGAKTVSVVFEDTVSLQGDLRELFQGWPLLERIDMAKADLSEVTGMFKLFDHCQLLEEIILAPDADLRKVASMEKMFYGLSSLTSLTLPTTLELDSVTTMQYMFTGCTALTSITVPDIIAPNLTNMSSMFAGESNVSACDGLQSVTFGIIHAEKLETMASMFYHCSALETVVFGKEAATPDLIQYITPNLQYMNDMFRWCEQLSSITFDQSFDTSNVTSMSGMFNNCKALRVLDLKAFDTSQLQSMSSMFSWSGLREIDLTSFNTANVKYMNNMFETCTALTTLKWNADTFTTGNVKNMNKMFNACSALTTLDVSHFDTKNVTDMANMFSGTKYALKELDLTGWNTSKVTNMSGMFDSCYSISVYDLSSFDTSQVTDMSRMFYDNKAVTKIIVSENFVTDQVTSSGSMFYVPYATTKPFYGGNRTQWVNTNPTDKTYACIDGILVDGKSMPGYFTVTPHDDHGETFYNANADGVTHTLYCGIYGEPINTENHTIDADGKCSLCGATVFTLVFKTNDGTNASATVTGNTATFQIPNTIPTREDGNYVFLGYDTNPNVDVANVTYKWIGDGFSQDFVFSGTDTTATLHAIWSQNTVSFGMEESSSELPVLTAVEGMTWGAWIKSDYNTDDKIKYGDIDGMNNVLYYFSTDEEYLYIADLSDHPVRISDVIKEGISYTAVVADAT